jgi:hypothetical protein
VGKPRSVLNNAVESIGNHWQSPVMVHEGFRMGLFFGKKIFPDNGTADQQSASYAFKVYKNS